MIAASLICSILSAILLLASWSWFALVIRRMASRVSALETFARNSCVIWNTTFASCASCKKTLFVTNASRFVDVGGDRAYYCEDCRKEGLDA